MSDRFVEISIRDITIRTRVLSLPFEVDRLEFYRLRTETEKNTDDLRAYGKSTHEILTEAMRREYYRSVPHMAWAQAAAARVNGLLYPEWWQRFDPFGGTAGNGPEILPRGR